MADFLNGPTTYGERFQEIAATARKMDEAAKEAVKPDFKKGKR
jgi:hypothetical protein